MSTQCIKPFFRRRLDPPASWSGDSPAWLYACGNRAVVRASLDESRRILTLRTDRTDDSASGYILRLPAGVRRIEIASGHVVELHEVAVWVALPLLAWTIAARWIKSAQYRRQSLATAFGLLRRMAFREMARRILLRGGAEITRDAPLPAVQSPVRPRRRESGPIRTAFVGPTLVQEGGPISLLELTLGLSESGRAIPVPFSFSEGPLRPVYAASGLTVRMESLPALLDKDGLDAAIDILVGGFRREEVEAVVANTAHAFPAVLAAGAAGLPCLWIIREGEPPQRVFADYSLDIGTQAVAATGIANGLIFVAEATRKNWSNLYPASRTFLIRNALHPGRFMAAVARINRAAARRRLGLDESSFVALLPGTLCARKGQIDLVRAVGVLSEAVARTTIALLVGAAELDYASKIAAAIKSLPPALRQRVRLDPATDDMAPYYAAADMFVCASRNESYPRIVLEAMATGLPIVTTPVDGISELVREGESALFFSPGDSAALAAHLGLMANDPSLRRRYAGEARAAFEVMAPFKTMIGEYETMLSDLFSD